MVGAGLKDVSIYVQRARASVVIDTAARAWSVGVPWAEALHLSKEAMAQAAAALPPPLQRRSRKGNAKGKGKGKGRGHR